MQCVWFRSLSWKPGGCVGCYLHILTRQVRNYEPEERVLVAGFNELDELEGLGLAAGVSAVNFRTQLG